MSRKTIDIMISSRCNDPIPFDGKERCLSDVRERLKAEIEAATIFGKPIFSVWINEGASPGEGSTKAWDACLDQARKADIFLSVYNGNAGWAHESGVGICHAELEKAISAQPAKIRLIEVEPAKIADEKDKRFAKYISELNLFRGATVKTGEELIERCKEAILAATIDMTHLGLREARKGKLHIGEALDWNRLDYHRRRDAMVSILRSALLEQPDAEETGDHVFVSVGGESVLVRCHGVPAAMSIPEAREMVGQPFLRDHELADALDDGRAGPIHMIACHKNVTEAQARRQLGFPDAVILSPPFGVYVADNIQKIQLLFIANCSDETSTRHGIQRVFEWLSETGEEILLAQRAAARSRIVRVVAGEQEKTSP